MNEIYPEIQKVAIGADNDVENNEKVWNIWHDKIHLSNIMS